jgi:hypothetical protein
VDVEFHQTFVAHFQKQGLAGFLIGQVGPPHELIGLLRLLAERIQDILAVFQHNGSCIPKLAFTMNGSGHDDFDLPVIKISGRKRVAGHLSITDQFARRYFCAKAFVGSPVCRMQRCRAFPFAIRKDTACGPSMISCSVGLAAIRIRYSLWIPEEAALSVPASLPRLAFVSGW